MQIVATFDNYEEMEAFAEKIVREKKVKAEQEKEVPQDNQTPVQPSVPVNQPSAPVQPAVPVAQPGFSPTPQGIPVAQPAVPAQQAFTQAPQQAQPAVPTAAQTYTLDELARAAMTLMDAGRQMDLQGLLRNFGVEALPALPKDQYGAFATALRGMGAQI